ncbi:MAG TPA: TonB-dependent receptor, partial [Woeseiaceae bacterium]|nr:TonB-dependent receptor [Woeseiaceae bacterium]
LQVVDSDFITDVGVANVQEALQLNPAFGEPGQSRYTSNGSIVNAGAATLNLRNLGADRTLVLADGKRVVAGVPGTAQVDVTMVPTGFIERVEVLTGGASAVYGSDAIAGVVNFIYKTDFQGIDVRTQYGESSEGDGEEILFDFTAGHNFADGNGNFMIHLGYSDQEGLDNGLRPFSDDSYASMVVAQGSSDPADLYTVVLNRSTVQPRGQIGVGSPNQTFVFTDDGTGLIPFDSSIQDAPYRFDPREFDGAQDNLAAPVQRLTTAARATYEFNPHFRTFLDMNYGRVDSTGSNTFHPYVSTFDFGIGISQRQEIESRLVNPADGTVTIVQNPFLPQEVFDLATDEDGDGLRDISYAKRVVEFGNRRTEIERQQFRIVLGTEGDINDNWAYDLYYSYGRSDLYGRQLGLYITPNLFQSLRAVSDVFDFDGDGDTSEAICAEANARLYDCVPINFYGVNNVSDAAREYVQGGDGAAFQKSYQDMNVVSANVTGTLFDLPAGPLQVAGGVEYREETSSHQFDPLYNTLQNGFTQQRDVEGSIDVSEVYAEVAVPILADLPGIQDLSLRAAGRYSDYSTLGGFPAYNFGLEWSPIDDLRFRAVYARAVRAPNIGELFRPAAAGVTSIVDPCNGVTTSDSGTLASQCLADPGVAQNASENGGTVTFIQTDFQGVGTLSITNPNIQEETGDTYTFGLVYTPEFIPGLFLTVDYYDIEIDDAISSVSTQFIIDQCYQAGNDAFCALVDRRPAAAAPASAGSISLIRSGLVNSGGAFAEGVDITAGYATDLWDGTLSIDLSWTHLLDQGVIPQIGADPNNQAGEVGFPENKAVLKLKYDIGAWTFAATNQIIGESFIDDQFLRSRFGADTDVTDDYFAFDAVLYTDLQVQYRLQDTYQFYLGVNNLWDEEPPAILSGIPGNRNANYDIIGQYVYFGVGAEF